MEPSISQLIAFVMEELSTDSCSPQSINGGPLHIFVSGVDGQLESMLVPVQSFSEYLLTCITN